MVFFHLPKIQYFLAPDDLFSIHTHLTRNKGPAYCYYSHLELATSLAVMLRNNNNNNTVAASG